MLILALAEDVSAEPISGSAEVHANDAVARARRVLVQERLESHEARPHLNIRRLEITSCIVEFWPSSTLSIPRLCPSYSTLTSAAEASGLVVATRTIALTVPLAVGTARGVHVRWRITGSDRSILGGSNSGVSGPGAACIPSGATPPLAGAAKLTRAEMQAAVRQTRSSFFEILDHRVHLWCAEQ